MRKSLGRKRLGFERLEGREVLSTVSGGVITTPDLRIPDFGAHPTVTSVASGNWSNPAIWSTGKVPGVGDVVDVGNAVAYDADSTVAIGTVEVLSSGKLAFATAVNTELVVSNLVVLQGGELDVGTVAAPVTASASILFADTPLNTATDPQQYGNGLIGLGTVTMHGATLSDSFVALASEPHAGDTTLSLSAPVAGWKVGDVLVLPDTRQIDTRPSETPNYVPQWEQPTIAAVSADGKTLTLSAPLAFNHFGARDASGTLRYLPHVGDLTRNVVVSSVNPAGNRGYTLFTDRANVDIEDVAFEGLGRQTLGDPNDTTFDSAGNVTHVGTNQEDRNPVTFVGLNGPTTAQADGYQYTFRGDSVYCDMPGMATRVWGINVDNSHYGLIQDNLVYGWAGAGIIARSGAETGNVFDHNFVLRIDGTGFREGPDPAGFPGTDMAGTGFWFRGPNNTVTNNVAADCVTLDNNPYSYGFSVYAEHLGTVTVPAYQGADPTIAGQGKGVNMNAVTLPGWSGNEVYSSQAGVVFFNLGSDAGTVGDALGTAGIMKNQTVWNQAFYGYFGYETTNLTIDGFTDLGDLGRLNSSEAIGLWFSDYIIRGLVVTNADIEDEPTGIIAPRHSDGVATIENSKLIDNGDVVVQTMSYSNPAVFSAKKTLLINDTFGAPAGKPLGAVVMAYDGTLDNHANFVQSDTVFVTSYNGVAGDDFQVFYSQQAPTFIVPVTDSRNVGAPVAGLTNAQAWAQYGVAIAGAVLPANAVSRTGIVGYVLPTATAPAAPTTLTAMGGEGTISLAWTASSGATSYNVYRGTASGGEKLLASGITGTPYTDSVIGTFFYEVTAVDSAGESAKSAEVSATSTVDTPVVAAGSAAFTALAGVLSPAQTVATFADPAGAEATSAYSANVNWGDGSSSAGSVSYSTATGLFSISGSHTYAAAGSETITVTIGDGNAPTVTVTDSLTVNSQLSTTTLGKYVTAAYESVLARVPTADELQAAYSALTAGTLTRSTFSLSLVNSVEHAENIVNADYLKFLGRAADPDGRNFWAGKIVGGETDEWLEAAFAGSAEYYQHAGGTDLKWVDQMYLDVLGSAADPQGETSWVAYLAAGGSRADVAHGFAVSPERETEHIAANYENYLGRAPDAPGEVYWLNQFESGGMTNETMVAGFVASDEYFNAHS